ncbi:MAG: hypothetical protein WCK29_04260, partial [archaeon]
EINVIGNIVDRRMPIGMRTLDYSAHPYIDGPNGLGSGMFRANSKDTIEIFGKAKSKGYILYFPSTHLLKARHGDKSMGWELREDERELMQKIWEEVK